LRETGSLSYLELASRAAKASLAVLPPEQHNTDALMVMSHVEYAEHQFEAARDHARRLAELDPGKSYPYHTLGDSLLELGDYDGASAAFNQMERLGRGREGLNSAATDQRLGRHAALLGNTDMAKRYYEDALGIALQSPSPQRETVAWCRWQLGELAFSVGDYKSAEQHYNDALTTFPDYFRASASLGRVLAARGDLTGAISQLERAVRLVPDPSFVASLGDLYTLAGRHNEAEAQYALVEQIGRLTALNGALYNRQLALFRADHEVRVEDAYLDAKREYGSRRDIYGADAVAWTALKAGKLSEAQQAMKEALRLGTRDARLLYHAGLIERAAGNNSASRDFLERALELCPEFDPMQSVIAKNALAAMSGKRS